MDINDVVLKRMERIEKNLEKLEKKRSLSYEEFSKDTDAQDIVLHNFQVTIEACLDIGSHIIAEKNWETPESYADIVRILSNHGVIPKNFEPIFTNMARFRNIIIHDYLYIDLQKVYENLQRIDDFRIYLKYIKEFLEKSQNIT